MKRKVIRLAEKTLVISLPSKWAKAHGVKKGSELEVEPSDATLIIRTHAAKTPAKASLHLSSSPELARKRIRTAYKRGFDELELTFSDPKIIKALQHELSSLLGYEIVKQGEKHCIVKNIAATMDDEFDTILRRLFLMILEMGRDSFDALQKKEYDRLPEISLAEQTNDKLTNVCKRILHKHSYHNPERTILLYALLRDLEKTADSYEHICLEAHKNKTSNDAVSILANLNALFELAYKMHYDFNDDSVSKLLALEKQLEKKFSGAITSTMQHHLKNLFVKIQELSEVIYALAL